MKKGATIFVLMLAFLIGGKAFSQATKNVASWKADMDNFRTTGTGRDYIRAEIESVCGGDGYFAGFYLIFGLTRSWQATGDNVYLDIAFDIIEGDMNGAISTRDLYGFSGQQEGLFYTPRYPQKTNVQLPNWFDEEGITLGSYFSPDYDRYADNHQFDGPLGTGFSYNYFEATGARLAYRTHVLDENIYYRYVAQLLQIMNANRNNGSWFTSTSGNGRTYEQRYNDALNYIITNIWEKWVETTPDGANLNSALNAFVYRGNTHMCSHLASTAAALWSITGEQKYKDFAEAYLWDFSHPSQPIIPAGVGLLDKFELQNTGTYQPWYNWVHKWDKNLSNNNAQDISHAGPEVNFLIQCYDLGIGLVAPPGEIAVDATLIQRLVNMMKEGVIVGNPETSTIITYYIGNTNPGDTRYNWWNENQLGQGLYDLAQYDQQILRFLENNILGNIERSQTFGHGAYAAAVLGVNGSNPPVYPTNGGQSGGNNTPFVEPLQGSPPGSSTKTVVLLVGDSFTLGGATWTDPEDGTGSISSPVGIQRLSDGATVGSISTASVETFIAQYQYTDTDGATGSGFLRVEVQEEQNDCPVLIFTDNEGDSQSQEIYWGETWTRPTVTSFDTEDGADFGPVLETDVNGALPILNGVVSDEQTEIGTYVIQYSITDSAGCEVVEDYTVTVLEAPDCPTGIAATNPAAENVLIGQNFVPQFTVSPNQENYGIRIISGPATGPDGNGRITITGSGTVVVEGYTITNSICTTEYTAQKTYNSQSVNTAFSLIPYIEYLKIIK